MGRFAPMRAATSTTTWTSLSATSPRWPRTGSTRSAFRTRPLRAPCSTWPSGTDSGSWWDCPPNNMWASSSMARRRWPRSALIRGRVRECAGHPALLCYALGNEIPAPMARWLGRPKIERYLERLYRVVKEADPEGLVTYVNYPTTEYLRLPFLDLLCFNVYLESQERFDAYLARL